MKKKIEILTVLSIVTGFLSLIPGILSFNINQSYNVINQYGDTVTLWGAGIYTHDSYFKAPILIGTDITMLFVLLLMTIALISFRRKNSQKSLLFLAGLLSIHLYYSFSQGFGVVYNQLQLVYITSFGASFFGFIFCLIQLDPQLLAEKQHWNPATRGVQLLLLIAGTALFVAWLPDILSSLLTGKSLEQIAIYTTEITYVIDMGVISPFIFIVFALLKKEHVSTHIFLPVTLILCTAVGLMVTLQTVIMVLAGIELPLVALLTKVTSFILLSAFSLTYTIRYFQNLES